MSRYLHANYLGTRTVAYNSSFGCPFACSFCAVVAMSNRRWLAQSPARMEQALRHLVATYGVDAVQMHDMDFFISEARTAEFASRIAIVSGISAVSTIASAKRLRMRPETAIPPILPTNPPPSKHPTPQPRQPLLPPTTSQPVRPCSPFGLRAPEALKPALRAGEGPHVPARRTR